MTNNPCEIPVDDLDALADWLEAEAYADWPAESQIHDSTGPHFGNVRTWVTEELFASLTDAAGAHPLCSATVKELYGDDATRGGWSVSVKVANEGTSSDWFWYEVYNGEIFASGTDVDLCVGCHGAGADYVLTPVPLQ